MTSSSIACHICSVSVMKKIPHPADATIKSSIPHWMMQRGSNRSASEPTATENSRNGSQCDSTAKPASAGEWNFWNTTQ
jgi:hypothetical protein